MHSTRRRFLQTMAGSASLGLADLTGLAAYAADEPVPDKVRYAADLEPIVRLIEETPRDKCIPVFLDQLRRGLPYRRFLAALFFAPIRRQDCHHEVYKIHSVHQLSMDVRPEERLLPLFWALDANKQRQEVFPVPALSELKGPFPPPEKAGAEFHDAMKGDDRERIEHALVGLARSQGARQTMELLWPYGCGNGGAGGHQAIVVANCCRALETIGWQHADIVLRFIVRDLSWHGWKSDGNYAPNKARVDKHLDKLPAGWSAGKGEQAATLELFELIRAGKAEPACELTVKQLLGGTHAQSIWDAIHLATGELLIRESNGRSLWSRPLHANTSANALHYFFRTSTTTRTRFLVLLQAVAWASTFMAGSLRDINVTKLPPRPLPMGNEDAVAEIFASLPSRTCRLDAKAKTAITTYGKRPDADEACRKVFVLAKERPEAVPLFLREARSWFCQKVTCDAHDPKFVAAILEDVDWVSPEWRPHLLAGASHFLHGKQSEDNTAVQQIREALQKNG